MNIMSDEYNCKNFREMYIDTTTIDPSNMRIKIRESSINISPKENTIRTTECSL